MSILQRSAIVVEGGGMRGAFTAGVLDAFLEKQFNPFDLYVGVSSGSTNLSNYISGQHRRSLKFYTDYSLRREFIDYRRFVRGGDLLDLNWLWSTGEQEYPLDRETIFAQNPNFYLVLTHAVTGQAHYFKPQDSNLLDALQASSSIPVLTRKPVYIDGEPYFDGGVADALPVQWAAKQEHVNKIMVIRTRPQSYFKANSKSDPWVAKYLFKQKEGFAQSLISRTQRYNDSVSFLRTSNPIKMLEVSVPHQKGLANRLCQNAKKLYNTYQVGLETGYKAIEQWQAMADDES